jgi:hypothetical protein
VAQNDADNLASVIKQHTEASTHANDDLRIRTLFDKHYSKQRAIKHFLDVFN